jgi:CHASE1-domain containing sensor protein
VCNKCQQKSSTTENKKHTVFVDEVETQSREKSLQGSQTQEFHYSENKARYKIVTLTDTDAVVV